MSTLTGDIVLKAADSLPYEAHVIASALAIVVGGIICAFGLLRVGWIAELIPLVSISAFMTGSAIFIAVGQVPNLMGISRADLYDTRAETYRVIINTLKYLGYTTIDAALGLTALFMLYAIRSFFNYLARRQPHRAKFWYIINTTRTAFVILLYVMISAVSQLNLPRTSEGKDEAKFLILGPVPRGFQHAAVPIINSEIVSNFAGQLPAAVIVMLIEHISISKSFGRINNYTINPSQEMVAIGVSNLLGPFLGAYPATGSFSRTAIKSKAGVRTPIAGVITAIVVLLAIYALPPVFFYIPNAALSAVIIHAVGDLITPPNVVYQFWKVSPIEVPIFFAGVLLTIFTSIENGVYLTLAASMAVVILRMLLARGRFLGRVKVHSVIGDQYVTGDEARPAGKRKGGNSDESSRSIFVPLNNGDGSNPALGTEHPYPGIFIYRFSENFIYPNANHYLEHMVHEIFAQTRRTDPNSYAKPGDRPWNDPGPKKSQLAVLARDDRPTLKAVIMDMAAVNNMDVTSTQILIDVRNQLDRYAHPDKVQWHFANINNRWAKRALTAAGFGYAAPDEPEFRRWKPIFDITEIGSSGSAAEEAERRDNRRLTHSDVEAGRKSFSQREIDSVDDSDESNRISKEISASGAYKGASVRAQVVQGMNRPFFHPDLTSALQSAINNTEALRVEPVHGEAEGVQYAPGGDHVNPEKIEAR